MSVLGWSMTKRLETTTRRRMRADHHTPQTQVRFSAHHSITPSQQLAALFQLITHTLSFTHPLTKFAMISFDVSRGGGAEGLIRALAKSNLYQMDHHNFELSKPVEPFTGPEPKFTLPYSQYPHIIHNIVAYAEKEVLLALRATCQALNQRVDKEFARHLQVYSEINDIAIASRWLGRIPSFRFKGAISLGVSTAPDGMKDASETDLHRMRQEMVSQQTTPEIWLRVPPSSVAWFKNFMKNVHTIDMDGSISPIVLPLSRKDQTGLDPLGRDFVDVLPAKVIRMYPDSGGMYASCVPFTSRYLIHIVELDHPNRPAQRSWLHHSPTIPEGTEQILISVFLHPNLPPALSIAGELKYPNTMKRVAIDLESIPVDGVSRATPESFKALGYFWLKVFANFRPGIQFYVCNIHSWDNVRPALPMLTRDFIMMVFASCWLGPAAVSHRDPEELWAMCRQHLKFLHGGFDFADCELPLYYANPDGTMMLNADGSPSKMA